MKCPECKGSKEIVGYFPHYDSSVPLSQRKPSISIKCTFCDGAGTVPPDYKERVERGKKAKEVRLARGLTLRDAMDYNIPTDKLSRYERGAWVSPMWEEAIQAYLEIIKRLKTVYRR